MLELAVVEEGVNLCQLQQAHLHLLSGLSRLEDQFTLREDVVLEEKEEVCSVRLDEALSSLVLWKVPLLMAGGGMG